MEEKNLLRLINLKRQELDSEFAAANHVIGSEERFVRNMDPQVIELYRGVGKVMAKYRSGPVPKAFKIIPTLANWEQVLHMTSPNEWTAASMLEATKLFSSNLKGDMAQRFYNIILLPRLRDDIQEFKSLNFHLYSALKRALYKPAAFYKGIVLALCEDTEATLREAVIISSILKKSHVPLLHSAAAMLKIADMNYNPVRGVFLMDLISKNYALPYRVLDAIVDHFLRYTEEANVAWHQLLLKFSQLYANNISDDQKDALRQLTKRYTHPSISPEIRHILINSITPTS